MTDEQNDEILGRALARAIETQQVNETPYERSRLATRPARRGFPIWQALGVVGVLVLAVAFGSWFTRPGQSPVASTSTPSGSPTKTPAVATATPTPAPTAKTAPNHDVVYVARDGLPPVGIELRPGVITGRTAAERIQQRLNVLLEDGDLSKVAAEQIAGATTNVLYSASNAKKVSAAASVRIDGTIAFVDIVVTSDWGITGAAQTTAALQQLVYTATEEPGVRQVLLTQNGGKPARIDQIVFDKPLAREDVFLYDAGGQTDAVSGDLGGNGFGTATAAWSVDAAAPGLTRLVVTVSDPGGKVPAFAVTVDPDPRAPAPLSGGKSAISLLVAARDGGTVSTVVDQTPLRTVGVANGKFANGNEGVLYVLELDDLRPWRVYTLANPNRIVLDIGGTPQAVSDRIAVYAPTATGTVARTFTLSGAARVFEANVVWRVKDSRQNVVAEGHTTASLGTSPIWGTFSTQITLPATVTGNTTLEVFEVSPKDGSDQGLVAIPLTVK